MNHSLLPGLRLRTLGEMKLAPLSRAARMTSSRWASSSVRSGDDGGDHDAAADAGGDELAHRFEALDGATGAGFELLPDRFVERGDAEGDLGVGDLRQARPEFDVAEDGGRLREHVDRLLELEEDVEDAARDAVLDLGLLVGVAGGAEDDEVLVPARAVGAGRGARRRRSSSPAMRDSNSRPES